MDGDVAPAEDAGGEGFDLRVENEACTDQISRAAPLTTVVSPPAMKAADMLISPAWTLTGFWKAEPDLAADGAKRGRYRVFTSKPAQRLTNAPSLPMKLAMS